VSGAERGETRGPQPGESRKERVDRELRELLEEIRVILPGVEILFGFLILLPFQFREELTDLERILYLGAFLAVSAALALLVSPTIDHRLGFREMDKEAWLFRSNRRALAAAVLVTIGVGLAVYLVLETLLGGVLAAAIAALNGAWFIWFWFGIPLLRRARSRNREDR
jgi:Family of unknown function (DUF6328)